MPSRLRDKTHRAGAVDDLPVHAPESYPALLAVNSHAVRTDDPESFFSCQLQDFRLAIVLVEFTESGRVDDNALYLPGRHVPENSGAEPGRHGHYRQVYISRHRREVGITGQLKDLFIFGVDRVELSLIFHVDKETCKVEPACRRARRRADVGD